MTLEQKIAKLWRRTVNVPCTALGSDCMQWSGPLRCKGGYGQAPGGEGIHGERLAHRAAYVVRRGPIPEELELDHLCRNRLCINPDHLEAVTSAINAQRGMLARLTIEQARAIKVSIMPKRKLAAMYGVSPGLITHIRAGRNWKTA